MRLFMFQSDFIFGEVAVPGALWREVRGGDREALDVLGLPVHGSPMSLRTAVELEATPVGRVALRRWREGQDDIYRSAYADARRSLIAEEVRQLASEGCTEAQDLLARGIPSVEAEHFTETHACRGVWLVGQEACGGWSP